MGENPVLPCCCLALGEGETVRPSDEGCDVPDQWLCISKVREPIGTRRSSWFDDPTRIAKFTHTPERIRMRNPPCDINRAVSDKAVGPQPLELRGWVRIGPDRSPDVILKPVHGQECLLQSQVILQPSRINTSPQVLNVTTHPGVGGNELCDDRVSCLVGG